MRAKDVMSNGVIFVTSSATVFDAAELLTAEQISALPVVDRHGRVVGIVSEADLIRRAEIGTMPRPSCLERLFSDDSVRAARYLRSHSHHVKDVMTTPVVTVNEDATLAEVADLMAKHRIKRLPVVRDGMMVGMVSRSNLLQALISRDHGDGSDSPTDAQLRQSVTRAVAKRPWSSCFPTNVLVNAGVVHLWGFVTNDAVRDAYRVAAENVPGVKAVKNHLRILPASYLAWGV